MKMLFEMDKKDYGECTHTFTRNSARSIIIRNGKIAMIHSLKYDYYKFPGGGIESKENPVDAMMRETLEEAGLIVIAGTVKEYGYVHRIQKSDNDDRSEERRVGNTLEFIEPAIAIKKNRSVTESPYNRMMFEREALVLESLISDGLL